MIWMGLLLCLVSCKDAMETIGLSGDEIPAEGVTLNIELPNFSEKKINTRAGADESISNVTAVFYGESNTYKGMANVNIDGSKNADGTYQAKISNIPSGTKMVHLVTNVSNLEKTEASDLQNITTATSRAIDTNSPVCWGIVSLTELLDGSANVSLLRQYAKVTLKVDDAVDTVFPEKDAGLIINNTAAKSAIAPAGYNEPTDTLAPTTEFSSTDVGDGTHREVAVTETSAGVANVIIKAKYKGKEGYKEGYYKVGLYKDANKTSQYALLRNHNYTITVTKVNDYGFSTKEEAIKAQPENRIEAQIVDDNPAITKMIACKDYELGVSDKVYVDAEATSANVTVVTTLQEATSSDGSFYTVTPKDSWIHSNPTAVETNTNDGTNHSTQGKKYVLTFTLDKNDAQEESRTGTITVKSGDLMLTAQIIQKGYDFKRDDHRLVTLLDGSNELTTNDYFTWLDKVQGITPKEIHDGDVAVVRNEGLHFSPGNNTYSYLIKKLDGDSFENSDTRFTVEDNGSGYWKVTLKNSNDNSLWKSSFNIKNTARVKITYDVYHTGIFHQISNTDNQMAEDGEYSKLVQGWFYYEVVKVKGNSGKIYLMLDRNLGASNNGPYIRETKALEGNEKAIGGYFYIATSKSDNLSKTLSPRGYEIPEMKVFEDLINGSDPAIQVVPETTPSGETYSRAEIKTVDSQLSRIYLPYGGYLENEVLRNPIHVDLWTRTPLSGTQGFASTSPDYGFWYKYFDIYNKSLNFSNVRFVSGSNGKNTGRYKAMPIRLVRVLE